LRKIIDEIDYNVKSFHILKIEYLLIIKHN